MALILIILDLITLARGDVVKSPAPCRDGAPASCSSFLFHPLNQGLQQSSQQVAQLFGVAAGDVLPFLEQKSIVGYYVRVNCSCVNQTLFAMTSYSVTGDDSAGLDSISRAKFDNMVWTEGGDASNIQPGSTIQLRLLCGCSRNSNWKSVLTYTVAPQDVLLTIAQKFASSVPDIVSMNNITNADVIQAGDQVLFVPTNLPPASESPRASSTASSRHEAKKKRAILVILIVVLALSTASLLACLFFALQRRHGKQPSPVCKNAEEQLTFSRKSFETVSTKASKNISGAGAEELNLENEKPLIFSFEEVRAATHNFSESKKLGEGAYGDVYYGNLRSQHVAIKQMKNSKSKEFFAELKVLSRVHHTNLVELIGYAVGDDTLFLVYELALNGALSDHLHKPETRGHEVLAWTMRVQIALDAARGLEYIHEHTKARYVHRDIKSSNILLDASFRAKVADFGLVKLGSMEGDGEGVTTGVVGTFGYLAPEYVRAGHATSKSDVYAFGVLLMELITGLEALLIVNNGTASGRPLKRSLTTLVLNSLEEDGPTLEFQNLVDPRLEQHYPIECASRMGMLARACTLEESMARPDMKQVVLSLSHILLSSIEWEASLAGNSQIFSGVFQGR